MPSSPEVIQQLVDYPRESLAVELKGWFDTDSPEGQAKIVQGCIAMRNRGTGGFILLGFDNQTTVPDLAGGETLEQLDRIGKEDRLRAGHGLVTIIGADGRASYRYIGALGGDDMEDGLAAEWLEEGWLKRRVERRRKGAEAPSIPKHLG